MDGQNPNNKKIYNHGLRLVKGYSDDNKPRHDDSTTAQKNTKKNPLIKQLTALTDSIDADVKMLLDL